MTKLTNFPSITNDLQPRRGLKLPGRPRPAEAQAGAELTDAKIEENADKLKRVHATVELAKPGGVRAERRRRSRAPVPTGMLQVEVPKTLLQELGMKAIQEETTKSSLVLKALAEAGYSVDPAFLVPDRRKE